MVEDTFGLVDVVEGEGDLALAEHVPGSVEEFSCDLGIHDVVDHGVYVCSAVELSCELWRDPVRHLCAERRVPRCRRVVGCKEEMSEVKRRRKKRGWMGAGE